MNLSYLNFVDEFLEPLIKIILYYPKTIFSF